MKPLMRERRGGGGGVPGTLQAHTQKAQVRNLAVNLIMNLADEIKTMK